MTDLIPQPASVAPVKGPRFRSALLLIVPLPLVLGIIGWGRHESRQAALSSTWQGLLQACTFELAFFGVILGLALWLAKPTKDELLLRFPHPWLLSLLGAGYSVAIRLAVGLLGAVILGFLLLNHLVTEESALAFAAANRPDVETVVSLKALKNDPVYYWLTLAVVSFIVAGLREELWRATSLAALRRLWPRGFGSRRGEYAAVALTSAIFGIGHIPQGMIAVAGTAAIGFLLGVIMVFHRSIWPAVIAHGFFDATSFALIPFVLDKLPKPH